MSEPFVVIRLSEPALRMLTAAASLASIELTFGERDEEPEQTAVAKMHLLSTVQELGGTAALYDLIETISAGVCALMDEDGYFPGERG